jgi:hypothetical protein
MFLSVKAPRYMTVASLLATCLIGGGARDIQILGSEVYSKTGE